MATTNGLNKDEMVPPSFLTKEYLESVLKKTENDKNAKLLDYAIKPGTKAGDHYASIMFKVYVKYTTRSKTIENNLVLKTIPLEGEGMKKEMLTEMPLFSNEIRIYTKILPEMERILRLCGDNDEMGPRIFYQTMDPPVIILEDITKQGYEMVYENLNFENAKKVIDKIAKYHALSFYIAEEKTEDVNFESPFNNPKAKDMFTKFLDGISCITDQMESWTGFEQIYAKLKGSEEKILDNVMKLYQPNKSWGYSVLNHGDFHIRNMMFKTNGKIIDDVMLLDFQIPFWGSPAIDLAYLIYMIGNEEVRDRKSEVYGLYHSKFCAYLDKFGYLKKPPSLLDLNIEILKGGHEELFLMLCFMPLFFIDFDKIDLAEFMESTGDAAKAQNAALYSNPELIAFYKKRLPELFYKGYMD